MVQVSADANPGTLGQQDGSAEGSGISSLLLGACCGFERLRVVIVETGDERS